VGVGPGGIRQLLTSLAGSLDWHSNDTPMTSIDAPAGSAMRPQHVMRTAHRPTACKCEHRMLPANGPLQEAQARAVINMVAEVIKGMGGSLSVDRVHNGEPETDAPCSWMMQRTHAVPLITELLLTQICVATHSWARLPPSCVTQHVI
jgi:hypothetical protein